MGAGGAPRGSGKAGGTADRVAVPLNGFDLARALPNSELHWLRGAGHYSPWERPERIAELIGEFAAGL